MNTSNSVLRLRAALLLLTCCLGAACSSPTDSGTAPVVVDLEQARQSLLEQDQRFAEAVESQGIAQAYRRFMAEDAIQLPDGGLAIGGRDAIYAELQEVTRNVDFKLTWEPLEVQVAESGELGFTWGIYYFESLDELGAPYVAEGKYVYLWRNNDGRWELILDITNQTEPIYDEWAGDAGAVPEDLSPSEEDVNADTPASAGDLGY